MNQPTALDLADLNARFAIPGHLRFMESGPGLPMADIRTPLATARVALQGAQVLAWRPDGVAPVLWLSGAAVFEADKAVRGGIPVCWPWFGDRPGHSAHGFVRTRLWELRDIAIIGVGALISVFAMAQLGFLPPVVITAAYAFLSIRLEDTSILDFLRYAIRYFLLGQQTYAWGL